MRAVLALVAALTTLSAVPKGLVDVKLFGVVVYLVVAAYALAVTMHGRRSAAWFGWYWIDAAWLVFLCNTTLSGAPGLAALLMLPIIALALHFSVWHALVVALTSAIALMAPQLASESTYPFEARAMPWARLGVAISIVSCGPLAFWLVRPARATRRRVALLEALARHASPRRGLALNVKQLVDLLGECFAFERAVISLGGPEPRIFAWSRQSGDLRNVVDDEMQTVSNRLAPVEDAILFERHAARGLMVSGVDLANHKTKPLGDASAWVWVSSRGSGVVLPLTSFGQTQGHLWLSDCDKAFTAEDARWIHDVMSMAMPSMERADLMEQLQREGALKERERIGRDLHDSAVQPYVGLKYGLEALARTAGQGNPTLVGIQQLLKLTNDELQNLRDVVGGLRHGDDLRARESPLTAIERQAKRFETIYGVRVNIFAPQSDRLRGALGKHILHIVNEAMTNVRRHTSATAINIMIDIADSGVTLRLRNDHGADEALPAGFVPTSIQTRAEEMGGTISVCHERDFTEIQVLLPVLGVLR